jgi:hypothetical protein
MDVGIGCGAKAIVSHCRACISACFPVSATYRQNGEADRPLHTTQQLQPRVHHSQLEIGEVVKLLRIEPALRDKPVTTEVSTRGE